MLKSALSFGTIKALPARVLYQKNGTTCCCRPAMVTVEELIASTQLDDESQKRLQKVLKQVGYRGGDEVDDIVRRLREEDLDKEAALAELIPPLTLRERRALLNKIRPEGELILTVRWVLRDRQHLLWPVCYGLLMCWAASVGGFMGTAVFGRCGHAGKAHLTSLQA